MQITLDVVERTGAFILPQPPTPSGVGGHKPKQGLDSVLGLLQPFVSLTWKHRDEQISEQVHASVFSGPSEKDPVGAGG